MSSMKHIFISERKDDTISLNRSEFASTDYAVNWRNIIFLPFESQWQFFIISLVILNTLIIVYDITYFNQEEHDFSDVVYYIVQVIYCFDTVLSIAHRNMPNYREIQEHEPKNMLYLIMDLITLLPIYETYLLIKSVSVAFKHNVTFRSTIRLISLLRLYRLFEYLNTMTYTAGSNQLAIVTIGQYLQLVILTHLFAALWYILGCWECQNKNWTENLKQFKFNPKSSTDWFIICYTNIGNTFSNNVKSNLRAENSTERFVLLVIMLIGFIIHFMLFFAHLIETFTKLYRRQFTFIDNLDNIKKVLNELDIEKEWKQKTIDYYNVFWDKRNGIKDLPQIFKRLPIPLQKEITLDIYWEALRHSHLFGEEDMAFKRELSLRMKSEFYLSGDYVYQTNDLKSKMIYISSGVLQILSQEDEESPVISFSSGTLLNEFNCMLPCLTMVNVRCTTYCELQTLSIDSLYRALKKYPDKVNGIRQKFENRLLHAKEVHAFKTSNVNKIDPLDSSFKWIKGQWHHLTHQKNEKQDEMFDFKLNPCHTSQYLSLIVLSKDVELKTQAICLKSTCPFILEPHSSFRLFMEKLILVGVFLQSLIIPFVVAFTREITVLFLSICFILDFLYVLDIYFKLSTAIKTKNILINQFGAIVLYKLKEVSFLIDIMAIIPIDYLFYIQNNHRAATLLKLNRLLKMYQMLNYIIAQEKSIWYDNLKARMLKYIFIYTTTGYWFACLMYTITCFNETCTEKGWFKNLLLMLYNSQDNPGDYVAVLRSCFYAFSTYLQVGINSAYHLLPLELLVHHFLVIMGYFVFSYYYSCLCATFILNLEKQKIYRNYYSSMVISMRVNKLSLHLTNELIRMLQFWWYSSKNEELTETDGILKDATKELKDKIIKRRIIECFKRVPLFQMYDESTLSTIAECSKIKTLPANTEVVTKNSRSTWIHVILRGNCSMTSVMAGDRDRNTVTIQKPGNAFPVVEVLHQVLTLVSVTTITAVELISIPYVDIMECLDKCQETEEGLSKILKSHLKENEVTFLRKRGRLPDMTPIEHSLGQGDFFKYQVFDTDVLSKEERDYIGPWKSLGKLSFVRYFFRRRTFKPQEKFFLIWEGINSFLSLIRMLIHLWFFNLLIEHQKNVWYFVKLLDTLSVLDLYIRAHCQFYNESGILVTHPWTTAKHYFKTSFFLDLFNMVSFRMLRSREMSRSGKQAMLNTILSIITQPFKIYRLLGLIDWVLSDVQKTSRLLQTSKFVMIVLVLLLTCTTLTQAVTCPITWSEPNRDTLVMIYPENSWISSLHYKGNLTPFRIYMENLYLVSAMFSSTLLCSINVITNAELIYFSFLFIFLFLIRWIIFAIITSAKIGGNVKLTIFQERVKSFLSFVKSEYIDEDLIQHTIEHYEYFWKKTHGSNFSDTVRNLHPNLRAEIVTSLYGPTLESIELFQSVDSGFYRQLAIHLKVEHYKKDSEIIRCNDVQGLLYIIFRGKIDISIAGTKLCTLGNGGMFGCFEKKGISRQTITATAKFHVELLTIESNKFHNICKDFADVSHYLRTKNFLHQEFLESKKGFITRPSKDTSKLKVSISASHVMNPWYRKLFKKLIISIDHTDKWYSIWEYIVCVHIASLSSIFVMHLVLMGTVHEHKGVLITLLLFILDIIFLLQIYFHFNLTYTDNELGVIVDNHRLIFKKYISSFTFWVDAFTIFPLKSIVVLFTTNELILRYAIGNKIFRFVFLIQYYHYCKEILTVKNHLRWTYLIYWMAISIQMLTCLWWITACPNGRCYHLKSVMGTTEKDYVLAEEGMPSLLLAYQYVVNIFTTTGMTEIIPMNMLQIVSSLIIILVIQFSLIALSSEFATFIAIAQYSLSKYDYDIRQLRTYLEGRELSKPIMDKMWKYSLQLFQRQRGEWMPEIVTEAPGYLKQDLMMSLYGHHLIHHPLFEDTHTDFLRQLVVWLERCLFFPGNYLVEKGDMDGSMYFIHDGEVEVFDKNGNNLTFIGILTKNRAFGEAQGFYNIQHNLSYKARTVVDALILKKDNWNYLLEWFPATHELLLLRAYEYKLKKNAQLFMMDSNSDENDKNSKNMSGDLAARMKQHVVSHDKRSSFRIKM